MFVFIQCVAAAVREKGLRGLLGLVPFGENLYEIAADAMKRWQDKKRQEKQQEEVRQEFEQAAQMKLEEFERQMRQIAEDVAPDQSPEVQEALTQYLTLIPARIRQTFCRADNLTGQTVPMTWGIRQPEDVLPLLPTRLPR